ncbi:cytochrome P450 [Penicillium frequentans]|nr:cytochrome P450 [Penicillium glabrum]
MNLSNCLHDGHIYEKPYEFRPSRWFTEDKVKLTKMNNQFVPFGKGARSCIGQRLAWAEIYICLFQIFQKHTWELHCDTNERDVRIIADCVVGVVGPESDGVRVRCINPMPSMAGFNH